MFPERFLFAVPRKATLQARRGVPVHVAKTFGVTGPITLLHVDRDYRLYAINPPALPAVEAPKETP